MLLTDLNLRRFLSSSIQRMTSRGCGRERAEINRLRAVSPCNHHHARHTNANYACHMLEHTSGLARRLAAGLTDCGNLMQHSSAAPVIPVLFSRQSKPGN